MQPSQEGERGRETMRDGGRGDTWWGLRGCGRQGSGGDAPERLRCPLHGPSYLAAEGRGREALVGRIPSLSQAPLSSRRAPALHWGFAVSAPTEVGSVLLSWSE